MKRIVALMLLCIAALGSSAIAQKALRPADNAALRYWMAFAQMNDAAISPADAMRMDAMINGGSPWDESKFGALIEQNQAAIETMIRGTQLPYCEWGVEFELGPEAPIEYIPKARALARLNSMYSMRLAANGHYDAAVRSAIAGIHFAQHLAENASFLGTLTARSALLPALLQSRQLAASRKLRSEDFSMLQTAVKTLPEGGFDWPAAVNVEARALHSILISLSESKDPKSLTEKWFGPLREEGVRPPSRQDIDQTDRVMASYAKLLGMPPDTANSQLPTLQKEIGALDAVSQKAIPNPARMIAARAEVIKAQRETAEALGLH